MKLTFCLLVVLISRVGCAVPLPLLNIDLNRADVNLLHTFGLSNVDEIKRILQLTYPELRFAEFRSGKHVGQFHPAYTEGRETFPQIDLIATATPAELFHEVVHFFIDRARLAKWPAETASKGRSYISWQKEELKNLYVALERATEQKNDAEVIVRKIEITASLLRSLANQDGEEIEVIYFLIKNQRDLGLRASDLGLQAKNLQSHIGNFIMDSERLMTSTASHLNGKGTHFEPEQVIRVERARLEFGRVFDRLSELFQYVSSTSCREILKARPRI